MADKARHGERALPDVDRQQQFTLGVHRHPDPLGRPLQSLDGLSLADLAVLDRAEQGKEFIELHLPHPHVVEEVLGEGPQLLRRFDQPLQHRICIDLEHPRRAPDAQSLSQARDDPHDKLDRLPLAMEEGPEGLEKITTADDTQQLPPGTATRMAIGAEIPPSYPAAIRTVRVGAEMRGGIHVATASPCGHDAGWGR
jgi:hypothetical protein